MNEPTPAQPAEPRAPRIDVDAVGAQLKEHFPALFAGGAKPLKLKIQADIQQRAPGVFTRAQLSAFLHRYTLSTSYLIALTKAGARLDLDGQPAGEIADEHRQAAQAELGRRRERQEQRRALEAEQRRNRATLLRDWERTTLTRANFCVLKGVAVDELDALLEQARREAAERPLPPPHRPHGHRPPADRPPPDRPRPDHPRPDHPRHDRPRREPGRPEHAQPARPARPGDAARSPERPRQPKGDAPKAPPAPTGEAQP